MLACDILRILHLENTEPSDAYRVLGFLFASHHIHKIKSLNAYVGCDYSDKPRLGQFLIRLCGNELSEMEGTEIEKLITRKASKNGFHTQHQTVGVMGLCAACQSL